MVYQIKSIKFSACAETGGIMISDITAHYIIYAIEQIFYMVRMSCILTVIIIAITAITLMILYNLKK